MKKSKTNIYLLLQVVFLFPLQHLYAQQTRGNHFISCLCTPVCFVVQPVSPGSICAGSGSVSFSVHVSGTGPFLYQWKENGIAITDGGAYSGSHSDSLVISNPSFALNGKNYQCVVTNCVGQSSRTSNAVVLSVHTISGDINTDGIVNNGDFSLMNLVYNTPCANCPEDIVQDGFIDVKDFLHLLGRYNMICQ